jgi:hypothetical protein
MKKILPVLAALIAGFIIAVPVMRVSNPSGLAVSDSYNSQSACKPRPSPSPVKTKMPEPSPSPTVSSSSPAPTVTPTVSPSTPAEWTWVSSALDGQNSYPPYVVRNNVWNPQSGFTETIGADSASDWGVTADFPAGNQAVISYPDVQKTFTQPDDTDLPLADITSLTSSFAEKMPQSGIDAEAAYDIWLNSYNTEVMIWNENHGQTPAGTDVGTFMIDGVSYSFWDNAGISGGFPSGPFTFVMNSNESSGTVNIESVLTWLASHDYISSSSGLSDVEYGFEICSTNGISQDFTVTSYSVTES